MPWEETDSQIMTPLRPASEFQDGTFRTIPIKKDKPRVWGIVGKLKGDDTMTLQALRFPKEDGWTVPKAKRWFKEHEDSLGKNTEVSMSGELMQKQDFIFEIKELGEEQGTFTGYASVYSVEDEGGDVVEPGAFTKTIAERGNEVPILWQHNPGEPIGKGRLEDSERGLVIHGKLETELPEGQRAYLRLKKGLVKGLSIGFRALKDSVENGVRHLKEIKLFEVSLVTFPMCEQALVTIVKALEDKAGRRMSIDSMGYAKRAMESMDKAMKLGEAMMDAMAAEEPDKTKMMAEMSDMADMCAAMMGHMHQAKGSIQALMGEEAGGKSTTPDEGAGGEATTSDAGAAAQQDSADLREALVSIKSTLQTLR